MYVWCGSQIHVILYAGEFAKRLTVHLGQYYSRFREAELATRCYTWGSLIVTPLMWVKDVRLAHTRIIQLWGSLTVYATGVSGSLTFTLQVWGSLTVMLWVRGSLPWITTVRLTVTLWVWDSLILELPLWGSHSYTICMWGSLTFTLGVWAHSHVSWGLLTVMLQV